ncbi:hypothetical protein GOP47_0010031 [Adiantum capillus-veneris]|uniref:Uncharacterized protein n=1 Tax=Adiantum capillus-veneris TaxID=13818 RepID=A0A9D4ZK93_ADICA|nr:hypothetical protein GOP47_0010031 [Adiantum capillus-veneris]
MWICKGRLVLRDGDGGPEGVAVLFVVVNGDLGARGGGLVEGGELLGEHLVAWAAGVVVGGVDFHTGVGGGEVHHDVTPTLVVVDAQRHQKILAVRILKAQRAGGAATAHAQRLLAIHLAPRATVGIVPHGLLHDAEPGRGVALNHPHMNGVRHACLSLLFATQLAEASCRLAAACCSCFQKLLLI